MDHDDLIKLLNQDLETEFQSIVQYVQHVATISGAEYTSTVDELKIHLTQELAHATALAEQISFLGGEPSTQVPDITHRPRLARCARSRPRPRDAQLEHYRERVQQANEAGLADVAEALRPLLTETQEHVRDLSTALGL